LTERQSFRLCLPVDKQSVYEMDVPASPYILNKNIIQIYPGETIYLEANETQDSMGLTSVKEIKNPEKTITIKCLQSVNKKKHEHIMLKVSNPFNRDLSYSARIFLMKENKWISTDVMPVRARLSAYELWPDVIITMALHDWKFLP
jgi:hypothetical protein